MELTKTKEKSKRLKDISGKWKLEYHPTGTMGAENFGGYTLHEFLNPKNHKTIYRRNPNGQAISYYMVAKILTIFRPDENPQDKLDVEWLIHHPEVKVQGYKNVPIEYAKAKQDSAKLTLIALDYQELDDIDEADYIDKLIGRISQTSGVHAIGLSKIRYILSELNRTYRDERYVTDAVVEKKLLATQLKTFVRKSMDNAKAVNKILLDDNMESARVNYEIKEMIRLNIITTNTNGMFKYDGLPIGTSVAGILNMWENEPTLRTDMLKELGSYQK